MARRRSKNKANFFQMGQDARQDYNAAVESRFVPTMRGVAPAGAGADYHYRNEARFLRLIERARDLQRNDPIMQAALMRLSSNVVMDGFPLDINTGDESIDADLKQQWKEWAENPSACHSEEELNWGQIEQLAFNSMLRDGDVFGLLLKSGQIQMVEADRVRTPRNTTRNVVHGILLDDMAKRQEVWISKEVLSPYQTLSKVSDVHRYPIWNSDGDRNVLQLYMPDRLSQRRGITAFAPSMETLAQHGDLQFNTLVKAQVASLIAILREHPETAQDVGSNLLSNGDDSAGSSYADTDAYGGITPIDGMASGLIIDGSPGSVLKGFSPSIPAPSHFDHTYMLLCHVAASVGLPVAVLLLDPQKSGSFSAWRGAMDQAKGRFRQLQKDFRNQFHNQVFRWWLKRRIAQDPILAAAASRSDIDLFNFSFGLPKHPYIEPMKDAQADAYQIENHLNSPRRIQAERGRDWDEVSLELVQDHGLLIRHALREHQAIMQEFPDADVSWRELLGLTPKTTTVALASSLAADSRSESTNTAQE